MACVDFYHFRPFLPRRRMNMLEGNEQCKACLRYSVQKAGHRWGIVMDYPISRSQNSRLPAFQHPDGSFLGRFALGQGRLD